MKRAFLVLMLLALGLVFAAPAQAQMLQWKDRVFVNANYAVLGTAETKVSSEKSVSLYDESGKITSEQTIESGGSSFEYGGGIRLFGNFGIGAAYSQTSTEGKATVSATLPHPIVYDRPRTANATVDALKHKEQVFHVMALFVLPLSSRFDVAVSAGPSFFTVEQDTLDSASIQTGTDAPPYTTISLTSVNKVIAKRSKTGFNAGAEATFRIIRNVGLSMFARYAKTSVEVSAEGAAQKLTLDVGGMQYGGGLRIMF